MAKTVDAGFEALLTLLSPSSVETQAAASHRASIEACLKSNFNMTSFFRSGSFGHHTSVSGYSDVDYFAVIPTEKLRAGSSVSLQDIRSALATRFPNTGVTVRSPAVVVPFGTGAWERHEITPADYVGITADSHRVFDIPNRADGWMRSSPAAHNAWVNAANFKLGNKLKPLIRLVKAWNYFHGAGKVRGNPAKALTDIVMLVRFAIGSVEALAPLSMDMAGRFNLWLGREKKAGRDYSQTQLSWLEAIRDHLSANIELDLRDLQDLPQFSQRGGIIAARVAFGPRLEEVIEDVTQALVA